MKQEELLQVESSQRQHHEDLLFQSRLNASVEAEEYNLFALLKPKVYMDGNQWCVHLGDANPMETIQGFGDTPYLAILDFNKSFYKKIPSHSQGRKQQ